MNRPSLCSVAAGLIAVGILMFATAVMAEDKTFGESITRLHAAQQAVAQKHFAEAKTAFSAILQRQDTPAHHRLEAEECLREIDRIEKGLPARDPTATRTALPKHLKPAIAFYVATNGNDANPGTQEKPFCSLERARDAVRDWKQKHSGRLPAGGVEIVLRGGEYSVTKTLELTAQDSGDEQSPVVYRAAAGEKPILRGGIRVTGFHPISDAAILARLPEESRGKVLCADLRSLGVKKLNPLVLGGFCSGRGFTTHPTQELFFDGKAMTLARWPNQGFATVRDIVVKDGEPSHGLVGSKTGRFLYDGDRPSRWLKENDAWLYGYWFWGWADSYEAIASIDPQKREITLKPPFSTYGYRKGQTYCAVNVLAEIDMPGEWYLDRTSAVLYFWPPANVEQATVELSLNDFPFVKMQNTSHVAWEGLTWELGGSNAIVANNANHCLLAGCTIRRCAGDAVTIDGTNNGVLSCNIDSFGRGGVMVSGGNRKTLAPGRNFIENCDISNLSRIDHTYTSAAVVSGVGNRIAHNRLHDIPSSAIRVGGNNHIVEFNDVFRVVLESDDQGGIDMWGDPTFRGNIFRYNSWRSIGNWQHPNEAPDCGQAGIRLDDAISGVLIYGNVFYRASAGKLGFGGIQIHGGKDNIVDNNLFVDCESAVSLSAWDDARWKQFVSKSLDAPEIDRKLYVEKYPTLAELAEHANRNTIARSLIVECRQFLRRDSKQLDLFENWETATDPGFRNLVKGDFHLQSPVPAATRIGWRPIPVEEIGLYRDAFRKELPK